MCRVGGCGSCDALSSFAAANVDISERASIRIVQSIFGAAVGELAKDKTASGVTKACGYLGLLDIDTIKMLVEPHQTALMRASVQCLMWRFGDEPKNVTMAKITVPVTLWICEHGSDGLKEVVRVCSAEKVVELKTAWKTMTGADYDRSSSDEEPDSDE